MIKLLYIYTLLFRLYISHTRALAHAHTRARSLSLSRTHTLPQVLRSVPILSSLSEDERESIVEAFASCHFKDGEFIIQQVCYYYYYYFIRIYYVFILLFVLWLY